jgi:hypothetical protein
MPYDVRQGRRGLGACLDNVGPEALASLGMLQAIVGLVVKVDHLLATRRAAVVIRWPGGSSVVYQLVNGESGDLVQGLRPLRCHAFLSLTVLRQLYPCLISWPGRGIVALADDDDEGTTGGGDGDAEDDTSANQLVLTVLLAVGKASSVGGKLVKPSVRRRAVVDQFAEGR